MDLDGGKEQDAEGAQGITISKVAAGKLKGI
jgi:hypothetical protein